LSVVAKAALSDIDLGELFTSDRPVIFFFDASFR